MYNILYECVYIIYSTWDFTVDIKVNQTYLQIFNIAGYSEHIKGLHITYNNMLTLQYKTTCKCTQNMNVRSTTSSYQAAVQSVELCQVMR